MAFYVVASYAIDRRDIGHGRRRVKLRCRSRCTDAAKRALDKTTPKACPAGDQHASAAPRTVHGGGERRCIPNIAAVNQARTGVLLCLAVDLHQKHAGALAYDGIFVQRSVWQPVATNRAVHAAVT